MFYQSVMQGLRPRGSRRSRRAAIAAVGLLGLLTYGLVAMPTASAVHDVGVLQLDGNAETSVQSDPPASDDWDRVCHQVTVTDDTDNSIPDQCTNPNPGDTTGATAVSFTQELNRSATIFTGGGSKDPQDISAWAWKDGAGGLPDKDNLLHAFAARYTSGGTDYLYFGSDRFDNSGDAVQGFWFLQNEVGLGSTPLGGGTSFDGVHEVGDLLVLSDFSNGGDVATINIYRWVESGGDTGTHLDFLDGGENVLCSPSLTSDDFCGIVSPPGLTPAPWTFTDKSGNTDFANGELLEAGVNLTALGLAGECFSTLVAESRSSTSPTATLKDFIVGDFDVCAPSMTTEASTAGPVTPGTPVHDTATITVTGAANPDDPTGDVTFFLCGPIPTGACDTGGTNVGTGTLDGGADATDGIAAATSPNVNTEASPLAPGRYCFRAEWPGDANYDGTSFTNDTDECFTVKDVSAVTTAQNWLPNDSATVTTQGGTPVSGTVEFTLYPSADCTGTALATFTDGSAPFTTNNTTVVTTDTTISWRVTFTPSDPDAVEGSTSHCETSTLTINNDIGM
jgi:hypothetical protein